MNNIFVTGASGFVGSNLVESLTQKGYNVVSLMRDIVPIPSLKNKLNKSTIVHGNLNDIHLLRRIISHYDINQVYHIAASAQVKSAWKDPIETFESNVMGTLNLFESIRSVNNNIKTIVLNTDKCYGEKLNAIETDKYEESEPYATSKICQAHITKSYIKTYGMNIKMLHSINIFGYDPLNSRLIGNTIKNCIMGIPPTIRTNDESIREYVYISDVIQTLEEITNKYLPCNVFHIYTGWVYNQNDIIHSILKRFPGLHEIYKEEDVPYQIQKETLSSCRWKWYPKISFDDAIDKTIDEYKQNIDEWKYK